MRRWSEGERGRRALAMTGLAGDTRAAPSVGRDRIPLQVRGVLGRLDWGNRTRAVRWAMLAPVLALFACFFLWPLVEVLLRSLDVHGHASYAGLDLTGSNYSDLVSDSALRGVFRETFVVAALSTLITGCLALPTAFLLTRLSRRLAAAILVLLLLPLWVSIVVRLFSLTAVLGHQGIVNELAGSLGLGGPYSLLFNGTSTIIGMVAYMLPYMILLLYAGMSGVDMSLLTAARTLGASRARAFTSIYVPLVRGAVLSSFLLIFVLSLGFFLTPKILGGPQNTTIPIYIQSQISNLEWGTASATGIVLLLLTIIGYVLALWFGGGRTGLGIGHGTSGKGEIRQEPLRFGPGSVLLWGITVLCLVFLLGPLLVVVRSAFDTGAMLVWPASGFTFKWFSEAMSDPNWTEPVVKSALVALGTAVISTVAALVMARGFARIRSPRRRAAVEAMVLTPLIVPVILLAVGLYSVESRIGLDGTNLGLILGHSMIAIPIAFVILAAGLARIDPSHETVAWTLGASRTRAFWTVVAPRLVPSILAALVSAFVMSWDEVVIAFMITGFSKTLPVQIFFELSQGGAPTLAAVATLLITLVIVGLVLSLVAQSVFRRFRRDQLGAG